jgi:FKBP-type peptidyl-prolyl cis-trans isomerase 2
LVNRFLKVSFSGKDSLSGKVFDTTSESEAKSAGIFEQRRYGPLAIIIGQKELLPLIEKELETMKAGESKTISLSPKDAFGERHAERVKVVPLKNFHDQKIAPFPGLVINAGGLPGKVQSVSSGRVRVDFNHPLAGHDVEYTIKVESEIVSPTEAAEEIFTKYYLMVPGAKKTISGNVLTVEINSAFIPKLEKANIAIAEAAKSVGVELKIVEAKAETKASGNEQPKAEMKIEMNSKPIESNVVSAAAPKPLAKNEMDSHTEIESKYKLNSSAKADAEEYPGTVIETKSGIKTFPASELNAKGSSKKEAPKGKFIIA